MSSRRKREKAIVRNYQAFAKKSFQMFFVSFLLMIVSAFLFNGFALRGENTIYAGIFVCITMLVYSILSPSRYAFEVYFTGSTGVFMAAMFPIIVIKSCLIAFIFLSAAAFFILFSLIKTNLRKLTARHDFLAIYIGFNYFLVMIVLILVFFLQHYLYFAEKLKLIY